MTKNKRNNRWIFWGFLLIPALILMLVSVHRNKQSPCLRCNVILVTIDSLRADALPCYGYALNTAPNLCAFAKANTRLTRAYANSSWTVPSQMSLFTGLYPKSHGIAYTIIDHLNPSVPTLPKVFAQSGYEAIAIANVQPNLGFEQGLGDGFSSVQLTKSGIRDAMPKWLTAIDAIKKANARGKPAFVYLHTDGVHDYQNLLADAPTTFPLDPSYRPPQVPNMRNEFDDGMWDKTYEQLLYIMKEDRVRNSDPRYPKLFDDINHATTRAQAKKVYDQLPRVDQNAILWQYDKDTVQARLGKNYAPLLRHLYDYALQTMDSEMNQFFQKIESENLMRNTIIIITSQHGEYLGEHALFGHGQQLFDTITHVPLIFHIPGINPRTVDALTGLNDLYPTVFSLVGITTAQPSGSVNQVGVLRQQSAAAQRDFIISQWSDIHTNSIYKDNWHLLESKPSGKLTFQLYNGETDPGEITNRADQNPEVSAALSKTLHTTLDALPIYHVTTSPFPDWIDEEHRKNLIETGYF